MDARIWMVDRHSGRDGAQRRVIKTTDDEAIAREVYHKTYEALRQGEVRLISPDGEVVKSFWAPRLRTRW